READPPLAVRRIAPGHRLPGAAGVRLPGPSGGEPRAARPEAPVRAFQPPDAAAPADAAAAGGGHPAPPARRWRRPLSVPRRTDIQSILIIGAGPIIIGQACEFEYSGAQACEALREEGYRVILVNSNLATIMTDPEMAAALYIEPVNARSLDEALAIAGEIGYPVVVRPSFTLGGSGGGIGYNREELETIVARGLDASPTGEVLLEESVIGWKEFEMEVVRDQRDNCIIVCSIENLDPMGVHTGDSITIAPALTL